MSRTVILHADDVGMCHGANQAFVQLARAAAERAGWPDFAPDACLVNRYAPGARLDRAQLPARARLGVSPRPDRLGACSIRTATCMTAA